MFLSHEVRNFGKNDPNLIELMVQRDGELFIFGLKPDADEIFFEFPTVQLAGMV